ncbi:MAG: BON domain-containing protein [Planctomycetaceae bacterium]|nr:BON domain-containing protein [Planctomycetaceae bacterium]
MSTPAVSHDRRSSQLSLSDDQLRRLIASRLAQFGSCVARDVIATVHGGDVVLAGAVGSDYERRVIEQSIERIAGIGTLNNLLDVRRSAPVTESVAFTGLSKRQVRLVAISAAAVGLLAVGWISCQFADTPSGQSAVPVVGTVRVQGEPATGAILTLHSLAARDATIVPPQGRIDGSGNIEWTTHVSGSIPSGEYAVTVVWPRARVRGNARQDTDVLAAAYGSVERSPLRLLIDPDAKCRVAFELSRSR